MIYNPVQVLLRKIYYNVFLLYLTSMNLLLFNQAWMTYNVSLAMIAVFAGWCVWVTRKNIYFCLLFTLIWLVFLPNTLYIVTDLEHIFHQWRFTSTLFTHSLLLVEYIVLLFLGVCTYVVSIYPVDKLVTHYFRKKHKDYEYVILILLNFFVGFGMVLGRIERINSWWVITNMHLVIAGFIEVLTSFNQIALVILFGLLSNFLYFLCKNVVSKYLKYLY